MSEDDGSRTGRSNDTVHNAIGYTVPVALQIGINLIPGIGIIFDVMQAISIFVDMFIDPGGFANTQTRSAIDEICSRQTVAGKKAINSPAYIEAVKSSIKAVAPTITPEQLDREVLLATAWYKKKLFYAPLSCYSDIANADATGVVLDVSMSGPPTDNCPEIYAGPYNAYVTENKAKYIAEKIQNSNLIIEASNTATILAARKKIKSDRNEYTIQFIITGVLFAISLITVTTLFLKQRKHERSR
jgi:hypothetical protein